MLEEMIYLTFAFASFYYTFPPCSPVRSARLTARETWEAMCRGAKMAVMLHRLRPKSLAYSLPATNPHLHRHHSLTGFSLSLHLIETSQPSTNTSISTSTSTSTSTALIRRGTHSITVLGKSLRACKRGDMGRGRGRRESDTPAYIVTPSLHQCRYTCVYSPISSQRLEHGRRCLPIISRYLLRATDGFCAGKRQV